MQYRTLGRTNLRVSEIGFGGAQVGIPNYMETWDPHGQREQ
jgi:aryl-alcohol dehydrogenase-like predicted oxidoreductase